VLYVDAEVMRLFAERLLQRAHLRVDPAATVSEALRTLATALAAFDLVGTGFNMSVSSGLDLARELARRHPGLPVVIASGYASDELRSGAVRKGQISR
jgi:DNA-binding NtrC family response regulator